MRRILLISLSIAILLASCKISEEPISQSNITVPQTSSNNVPMSTGEEQKNNHELTNKLMGTWADEPMVPASLGKVYRFDNATFEIHYAGLEIYKDRIISDFGTWEVNGNVLLLKITKRNMIEGGKVVEFLPSLFQIENGIEKMINVDPVEKKELLLIDLFQDDNLIDQYSRLCITVSGEKIWKFSNDSKWDEWDTQN